MKSLKAINLQQVLFLDIETVPLYANYNELSNSLQQNWDKKYEYLKHDENENSAIGFFKHAGIYSEFAKIICISIGRFKIENNELLFSVKSIANENEKQLLESFNSIFENRHDFKIIAGHNIKEFDVPFICRRMLINGLEIPILFDLSGRKSFEVNHLIDTLQLWKFGDYKHYTSLALLTEIMGFNTPKTDMEGKDVARVFYHENNLKRIADYCQQDVLAVAQLILKFRNENLLTDEQIRCIQN
jgi:uncharacterized protein YprB with RNaseH-like and TPR domain